MLRGSSVECVVDGEALSYAVLDNVIIATHDTTMRVIKIWRSLLGPGSRFAVKDRQIFHWHELQYEILVTAMVSRPFSHTYIRLFHHAGLLT